MVQIGLTDRDHIPHRFISVRVTKTVPTAAASSTTRQLQRTSGSVTALDDFRKSRHRKFATDHGYNGSKSFPGLN
jgi:hypothetical protein